MHRLFKIVKRINVNLLAYKKIPKRQGKLPGIILENPENGIRIQDVT